MTAPLTAHADALERAHRLTLGWLDSLDTRAVPPRATIDELVQALGPTLPDGRQSLVLVSDNNFAASQFTQFLLFAVD